MTAVSDSRPILMFDSGVGGLTVLREARVLMPDRRFVYIADDAACPYGAWEEDALREHLLALFDRLLGRYRPALSVIACNTASTLAIDFSRIAASRTSRAIGPAWSSDEAKATVPQREQRP